MSTLTARSILCFKYQYGPRAVLVKATEFDNVNGIAGNKLYTVTVIDGEDCKHLKPATLAEATRVAEDAVAKFVDALAFIYLPAQNCN